MDKSEKRFERDIENFLISPEGGYIQFNGQDTDGNWIRSRKNDLEHCIYMDVLTEFIEKTQPKEWARYTKYYGSRASEQLYNRIEKVISEQGLVYVLRNGIDDMGCKLRVCFFKPESDLNQTDKERYEANILGCDRQFHYSTHNNNSIDMVLSVNGIPIVAIELKNQFTGQSYLNALNQYRNNRSSKEFAFRFNHRFLVYFAVDLYEAWMTTRLTDDKTYFLSFNQGSNGPGVSGGKGNPDTGDGYATRYLWEEVLQRDSLMDILQKFISYVKEKETDSNGKTITKEKLIFPRYHQYDVVKKIISDVKENGTGKNYLIQHSAGSGKSNSIAWTAYRLASLHDDNNNSLFDSVIVVTNRVVLDGQLQDTINSFDHKVGLVEAIDERKNSKSLAEAINDKKRIIICTIQKFLFAYKDMDAFQGRNFAIIVDEAHQGQNGENAKFLRRSLIDIDVAVKEVAEDTGVPEEEIDVTNEYIAALLGQGEHKNQSFFAFTATPKGETLERFGCDAGDGRHIPFHVYSMRQAIEEGYILDVLQNYTTIKEAFKLVKTTEENPELVEGPAAKALFRYYKENGYTINQKTDMIMSNFLENGRYQIHGKGKAMVVADSRANAVRYYLAIKNYIKNHAEECAGTEVMIAFSGEVTLPETPDVTYSEATMNLNEKGKYITTDKEFRKEFHSSRYNILVVANKYQTGFDEPLLHSMYVDKKLKDITAVQTLSRLNRTCPGKTNTFVLDFENTSEEIKQAFLPYYNQTVLEGNTDLNKVYDYRAKINDYMLYNFDDVNKFYELMDKEKDKKQTPGVLGKLAAMFKPVITRYSELLEEQRYTYRDYLRGFNNIYSYVTQIVRLHDKELFKEFLYTSHLVRILPPEHTELPYVDDMIKMEYASLTETFSGAITLDEKPPVLILRPGTGGEKTPKKYDTLESIIQKVNDRFAGDFTESDKVIIRGIYDMFMKDENVEKYKKYAQDNNPEMFEKSLFPDKFKDLVTQCYMDNMETFKKIFEDPEFYAKVETAMSSELYKALRK